MVSDHTRKRNLESFEPSLKLISRILKIILEKNSLGKTNLSQEANIQYSRLVVHLEWLEKNRLIKQVIDDGKIKITVTSLGREFAKIISLA